MAFNAVFQLPEKRWGFQEFPDATSAIDWLKKYRIFSKKLVLNDQGEQVWPSPETSTEVDYLTR